MKQYLKEIVILFIQLLLFYIFPIFLFLYEPIGMVMIMLLVTFILGMIIGIISNNKIKYLYPIIIAVLFLPSVFIFYNESALIHSLWYLVIATVGLFIGSIVNLIIGKFKV